MDKIKQWIEITQKYQNGKFWEMVIDDNDQEKIMEDLDPQQDRTKIQSDTHSYPKTNIYLTDTDVILLMEIPGARRGYFFISIRE